MKHAFQIMCSLCLIIFFFRNPFRFKTGNANLVKVENLQKLKLRVILSLKNGLRQVCQLKNRKFENFYHLIALLVELKHALRVVGLTGFLKIR